jgi:hypothetical protein
VAYTINRRTTLSALATPALPDDPTHDDDNRLREGHPEVHHPPSPPLRTPHKLFVALCRDLVLSTTRRFVIPSGEGVPFSEISAMSLRSRTPSSGSLENSPDDRASCARHSGRGIASLSAQALCRRGDELSLFAMVY